jgi:hypothetical protein
MIFRKSGVNAGIERWLETDSKAVSEAVKTLKEQHFLLASGALGPKLLLSYGVMD